MRLRGVNADFHPGAGALAAVLAAILPLASAACGRQGSSGSSGASGAPGASSPTGLPQGVSLDAPEEHLTPPVAVVNGTTIYRATYDEILEALRGQIAPGDPDSVEKYIGAKTIALDKSIDEELLFQEAVRKGYQPKPEEISTIYADRIRQAGSEAKYLEAARNKMLSKGDLIQSYRKGIAIDRYVKAEIEATNSATDDEVRAFYETRPELFTPDKWMKVGQIFVNAPLEWAQKQRSEALTRLTQAVDKLRQGRSFESLARDISEDGAGPTGGMIGFVKRGGLAEQLDRAIFSMKPGEISNIIESEKGYHLLKVYDTKGGVLEPFDKVKGDARQKLLAKKRADAISALLSGLRQNAKIERLGG